MKITLLLLLILLPLYPIWGQNIHPVVSEDPVVLLLNLEARMKYNKVTVSHSGGVDGLKSKKYTRTLTYFFDNHGSLVEYSLVNHRRGKIEDAVHLLFELDDQGCYTKYSVLQEGEKREISAYRYTCGVDRIDTMFYGKGGYFDVTRFDSVGNRVRFQKFRSATDSIPSIELEYVWDKFSRIKKVRYPRDNTDGYGGISYEYQDNEIIGRPDVPDARYFCEIYETDDDGTPLRGVFYRQRRNKLIPIITYFFDWE